MTYKQVQRITASNNLTDRITLMLRDDIVGGKYQPGRQLPAGKDLSDLFGVSITVIREALSRLKSDGLVASHQGKGVFVAQKRQVYSKAERLRRLQHAVDAFVHEAVFLDFSAGEIRQAVNEKLESLDWGAKPRGG